ncbi:MAG TPA: type I polyketide synthase, partial [Actinophytocola sp.]|nr:type I polyketide synthase [Actinophytocola sp.]
TEAAPWPETGRPRRAAVSAFGASGTNAHVVLEYEPEPAEPPAALPDGLPMALPLSAKTTAALATRSRQLLSRLDTEPTTDLVRVGHTLAGRARLGHRAVVVGTDKEDLAGGLAALANGDAPAGVVTGQVASGRLAFVFSGQGSQRLGMGTGLYRSLPVFADAYDEVCAELDRHLAVPLGKVVFAEPGTSGAELLDRTEYTQPALFALEVALARVLDGWGIRPDVLAGHSIGELAAAHVAGVLDLADAATLVTARGRLMQAMPDTGAMVSVNVAEDVVRPLLAGHESEVDIAAVNGPDSVVLSGEADTVLAIADQLKAAGHRTKRLTVSHAFHSPHVDEVLAEFGAVAAKLRYSPPTVPVISDVTGAEADPAELATPEYWVRHVRAAVRWHETMRTLASDGVTTAIEIGYGDTLAAMLGQSSDTVAAIPLLRRTREEPVALAEALARLHVRGHADALPPWYPAASRPVPLPTYPFQHERFWLTPRRLADLDAVGAQATGHPLLGAVVGLPDHGGAVFTNHLSVREYPWLADHAVSGSVILPGTAMVEIALRAGEELGAGALDELVIEAPLVLPASGVALRVRVGESDTDGLRRVAIHARAHDQHPDGPDGGWTRHATGTLAVKPAEPGDGLRSWPPVGAVAVPVAGFYDRQADSGLDLGPAFQGLRAAWTRDDEAFAEVELPAE